MGGPSMRHLALGLVLGALVTLGASCPKPPPVPPPRPGVIPPGGAAEPVPPPIERPIPPGKQGDVPEVPPPVKP
jgi:hypothetical protein